MKIIKGNQQVRQAARDYENYSSNLQGDQDVRDYKQLPLEVDPPHHTEMRALLNPWFSRESVAQFEPEFRKIAKALISSFENEVEIRKVIAKVRAVPITVNYDLEILLSSEIDTFKCSQAIMDTLWLYKFMYFEYNFMNIDAVILMPDTNSIEMSREKNLTSDNNIELKASFEVQTYYPAFRKDIRPINFLHYE